MNMIIETLILGPFQVNCYIIGCRESMEAVVLDPGDDPDLILEAIGDTRLQVRYILLTHGHIDHLGAVAEVQESTGAKILLHKNDAFFLANAGLPDILFGGKFPQSGLKSVCPERQRFIYLHYPPGPNRIAGLLTVLFGKGRIALFRFPSGNRKTTNQIQQILLILSNTTSSLYTNHLEPRPRRTILAVWNMIIRSMTRDMFLM